MRRLAVSSLCVILASGLAACGDGGDGRSPEEAAQAPEAPAPAPADEGADSDIEFETSADPAERNAAEARAFLARNAEQPGVAETANGVQYQELASAPASARSPAPGDWTCVHYTASLIDGTVFDTTRTGDSAPPLLLPLTGMIPGWREAVSIMATGDHWRIAMPPNLAYGASGAQDTDGETLIPPNAALVFDVELLGVYRTEELPLTQELRIDPDWNCAEPPDAADAGGAEDAGQPGGAD